MNISFTPQSRISFNLSDKDFREFKLSVDKGDIIQGKVIKALDQRRALIQVKGMRITAQGSKSFIPGSSVILAVEGISDKIYAKFLGITSANFASSQELQHILQQASLMPTKTNLQILAKLLSLNLVFDTSYFKFIEKHLKAFTRGTLDEKISTALFALIAQLPARADILNRLWSVFFAGNQFVENLHVFGKQLRTILQRLTKNHGQRELLEDTLEFLESFIIESKNVKNVKSLAWLHKHSGLFYEHGILDRFGNAAPEFSADLKHYLVTLQKHLSDLDLTKQEYKALDAVLKNMLEHIEGEQLLSDTDKNKASLFATMPVRDGKERHTLQLHYESTEDESKQSKNHSFLFTVTTKHLGLVKVKLSAEDNAVHCNVMLEKEDVTAHFKAHGEELRERLGRLTKSFSIIDFATDKRKPSPLTWWFGDVASIREQVNVVI